MSIQGFFPFIPDYSTWENWNGNLIMYFSEEIIPYCSEEEWRVTAKNLVQLPTFLTAPVPDPDLYEDWQDWAHQCSIIINGSST
jgi:hypothetical protein